MLQIDLVAEVKKRRLPWAMFAFLAASALGAIWYLRRPEPPIEVEILRVERGDVRELVISASAGEVKPARRVTVRAELAGTVSAVKKKRGDRVETGELIVAFSSDDVDARLAQAEANIEAATVAVKSAVMRHDTAKRALERAKKLRASDAISEVELDKTETEARALEQAVEQARAAEKQAIAAKKIAEVAKKRSAVHAPFAGVLQDVYAELGVQLAPAAPLFDLIDDSQVRVDVPIDESDIARVFVGQSVLLESESHPGKQLPAKVTFIPPAVGKSNELGALETPVLQSKDRSLRVEVTPEDQTALRVGSSVNAELLVSVRKDVLFVPSHVVIGRGAERSVYRVIKGVARKTTFRPGLTSWERTEVLSGIELGDEVIAGLNTKGLEDGARVIARDAQPAAKPEKPAAEKPADASAARR